MKLAPTGSALTISRPKTNALTATASLALLLAIASFLPSLIFFVFDTSSGAVGLLIASVLLTAMITLGLGVAPTARDVSNALTVSIVAFVALGAHGAVAALLYPPELDRFAMSAVALGFTAFAGLLSIGTLFKTDAQSVRYATNIMRSLFFIAGIFGVMGIQPSISFYEKSIFPFTEPSHFVLALAPFLVDGCVRSTGAKRLLLLLAGYALAYFMQSLALVVTVTLAAGVCLSLPQLAVLGVMAASILSGGPFLNIEYFIERVSSNEGAQNISRLVYVQGWELVQGSLENSYGWGVGFQQLGFAPINSPTADQLFRLLRTDSNLKDGGFTAAKVISEFGVFGLIGTLSFVFLFIWSAWRLRGEALRRRRINPQLVLALSFIVGYFVEMFVRGVGYFSGTTMLLIAALGYVIPAIRSKNVFADVR